jgi:hypothetical protein
MAENVSVGKSGINGEAWDAIKFCERRAPMMGTKERSFAPLIHVSLEELVPQDHCYRHLERTIDLTGSLFKRPMKAWVVLQLIRWCSSNCNWSYFLREYEPLGD